MSRLPSLAIGLALVALAPTVRADATVWARARSPEAARRANLVAEVDSLLELHLRNSHELSDSSADPRLREAVRKLEEAGGMKSNDVNVLVRYGNVLDDLLDYAGCVRVLEAAVKMPAPPPVHAGAHERLAICHAHLGHQTEEIKNYDAALLLQSDTSARSLLLSNRAESLMAIGDISGAIAGYREAIVLRPYAATTYWGLGVALDRSGNLDGALEAIRIARTWDLHHRNLNGGNWFFSPPWDEPWYRALGHWQRAREATQPAARTEEYLSAVARWEEYISRAPADDRYLPLARVRLKECERERDRVLKRHPQSTSVPKPAPIWEVSPLPRKTPTAPRPPALSPTLPRVFDRGRSDAAPRTSARNRSITILQESVRPGAPRGGFFPSAPCREVSRGAELNQSFRSEAEAPAVQRDSLFGEPVVWSGRPKELSTRPSTSSARSSARSPPRSPRRWPSSSRARSAPRRADSCFAAWMGTLAVASASARVGGGGARVPVTDKHIVMRRGSLRRFIDIRPDQLRAHPLASQSARHRRSRARPRGSDRRSSAPSHDRASGLVAPDRVWAIMRGVTPSAPAGDGERLLAQRLDDGERVLWSAHPSAAWRAWLPTSFRAAGSLFIAIALGGSAVVTGTHAVHALRLFVKAGVDPASVAFVAVAASLSLTLVLLVAGAIALLYATVVRPARLDRKTRYWITDRRVLIRRGHVELHLDRSRIADVIDAPTEGGLHDIFLVLDGPRARSFRGERRLRREIRERPPARAPPHLRRRADPRDPPLARALPPRCLTP